MEVKADGILRKNRSLEAAIQNKEKSFGVRLKN